MRDITWYQRKILWQNQEQSYQNLGRNGRISTINNTYTYKNKLNKVRITIFNI